MTDITDPAIGAWLDQEDRRTAEMIRRHGVYIQYVGGAECECCVALNRADRRRAKRETSAPFAYTVGLFGLGHPELAVVGLSAGDAATMLNYLAAGVGMGRNLVPGEVIDSLEPRQRFLVEVVPNPGQIAFAANRYYQRPDAFSVGLLQVTWSDCEGRFPGEPGCSIPAHVQPRPGRWRA